MFLTIESARWPCCTTLSRLLRKVSVSSVISARVFLSAFTSPRVSCNSSISSTETAEKLLTKLSGFLISCAIPAVSWPSEASFSVWTRRSCVIRKSSSDLLKSSVRWQCVQQPHVFNRNRCLFGEGLDKGNLLIGEGP